jgi:hypothetical protein
MLGKLYAIELWKIPLVDVNVGRIILDISEDLCYELTNQLKTSRSALQPMRLKMHI